MKRIGLIFNWIPLTSESEPIRPANGMDWYRLVMPYFSLQDEYTIVTLSETDFDVNPLDCDIYVMNRSREYFRAERVKKEGKKLIIDIDDFWTLPTWHDLNPKKMQERLKVYEKQKDVDQIALNQYRRLTNLETNAEANIIKSMQIADVVTCTNEQLAEKIKPINPNVHVIRNTIHKSFQQYTNDKQRSKRLTFGWLGGSFHLRDVALMFNGITKLHRDKSEAGKYQFLSSYNGDSGEYREIEKVFTCNYCYVSPEYAELLKYNKPVSIHMGLNENYRRLWNVPVTEYGLLYENINVALIPLQHGTFNSMKSELKLVEAGMTGCAAIVSDVMPYSKWLRHGKNCLVTEGTNGWYTAFKMILNNPNLLEDIRSGLAETIEQEFNNETEAQKLKEICQRLA